MTTKPPPNACQRHISICTAHGSVSVYKQPINFRSECWAVICDTQNHKIVSFFFILCNGDIDLKLNMTGKLILARFLQNNHHLFLKWQTHTQNR